MPAKLFQSIKDYNEKYASKYNAKAIKGEKYINLDTKIKHKCLKCGYIRYVTPYDLSIYTCPNCQKLTKGYPVNRNYTIQEVKHKLKDFDIIYISGYTNHFKTRQTELTVKCGKCKTIYSATLQQIQLNKSHSCPVCTKNREQQIHESYKLSTKEINNKLKHLLGSPKIISEYINNQTPSLFKCKNGHTFTTTLGSLSTNSYGCPVCSCQLTLKQTSMVAIEAISSIEKRSQLLFQYLPKTVEYKVPGTPFKLDAYNKRYNIGIEFHGSYYHGEHDKRIKKYKDTIKRDKILQTKVHLIVIWEGEYRSNPKETIRRCVNQIKEIKLHKQLNHSHQEM